MQLAFETINKNLRFSEALLKDECVFLKQRIKVIKLSKSTLLIQRMIFTIFMKNLLNRKKITLVRKFSTDLVPLKASGKLPKNVKDGKPTFVIVICLMGFTSGSYLTLTSLLSKLREAIDSFGVFEGEKANLEILCIKTLSCSSLKIYPKMAPFTVKPIFDDLVNSMNITFAKIDEIEKSYKSHGITSMKNLGQSLLEKVILERKITPISDDHVVNNYNFFDLLNSILNEDTEIKSRVSKWSIKKRFFNFDTDVNTNFNYYINCTSQDILTYKKKKKKDESE